MYEQEIKRRRNDHLQASQEAIENRRDAESRQKRKRRREEFLKIWDNLTSDEQQDIEERAFSKQQGKVLKEHFRKNEKHRQRECLKELDRQQAE